MGSTVVITGFHAIAEALKHPGARGTLWLSGSRRRNAELEALARAAGVTVTWTTPQQVERLAAGQDHRGAVWVTEGGLVERRDLRSEIARLSDAEQDRRGPVSPRLVVVLDHLKDPHNLGAILRSADQFGVDLVLLPEKRSVQVTPVVARVSAGASAHVPTVVVSNLATSLRQLREAGFWVYGAHLEGQPLDRVRFADRSVLVLGAEDRGLATLTVRDCDELVSIPRAAGARVDSLNVSVAAGILLYGIRRSQGAFGSVTG